MNGPVVAGYDPNRTPGDAFYDPRIAAKYVDFFEQCLTHVEGKMAGKPFHLRHWQRDLIASIYGWRRQSGTKTVRRYREIFILIPRKNGKTPMAAGLCCCELFLSSERGKQIYCAASEREQAALMFRHVKGMIEAESLMARRCRVFKGIGSRSVQLLDDEASTLKVISADAETKHGFNSSLIVVDELHAFKSRDLIDVLTTSLASSNRAEPLIVYLTTADYGRPSICNQKRDYAEKVRDGIIEDAAFLPVIFAAGPDDDWRLESTWEKANPNIDVSVSREYLSRECLRAQQIPSEQNKFLRFHLNITTEQDVRAISMRDWDACGDEAPAAWRARQIARLATKECNAAIDLGNTRDLTALVLTFPDDDGGYTVLPWFWTPRERPGDGIDYSQWFAEGWIEPTPGNTTDYDRIRAAVNKLADQFGIEEIAVDRLFQGEQLCQQLYNDGLAVLAHRQGYAAMSPAYRKLEEAVFSRKIRHGGNPVLRWMASNVAIESDADGNVKPSKVKSSGRIDGVVALVMALGRADHLRGAASAYLDRGLLRV